MTLLLLVTLVSGQGHTTLLLLVTLVQRSGSHDPIAVGDPRSKVRVTGGMFDNITLYPIALTNLDKISMVHGSPAGVPCC